MNVELEALARLNERLKQTGEPPTCCEINAILLELIDRALARSAESFLQAGFSQEEVNEIIANQMPECERSRLQTLEAIMRAINNWDDNAPSYVLN